MNRPSGQSLKRRVRRYLLRVLLFTLLLDMSVCISFTSKSSISSEPITSRCVPLIFHASMYLATRRRRRSRMAFYYPRLEEKEDCIYRLPPPGNTQTQADLHHFWGDSPRMATASSLRILQWNANLMNLAKGSELSEFCAANKVDVICVSELGSYAPNLRNFTLAAFSCKGRGVGIYLRYHPSNSPGVVARISYISQMLMHLTVWV